MRTEHAGGSTPGTEHAGDGSFCVAARHEVEHAGDGSFWEARREVC